jgi:hypothetical protein
MVRTTVIAARGRSLRRDRYSRRSVMISRLKEVNPAVCDSIYKPMFLRDPARPAPFKHIPKGLRFAHTLKRIPHDCLKQIKEPESDAPVGFHPVSKVFPKLPLKYRETWGATGHRRSHVSDPARSWAALSRFRPAAKRRAIDERFAAIGGDALSRSARPVR